MRVWKRGGEREMREVKVREEDIRLSGWGGKRDIMNKGVTKLANVKMRNNHKNV